MIASSVPSPLSPLGGSSHCRPAKAQVRIHIRWMIRRDMPEVMDIEHASFEAPWCEEEFLRVLRQRNCIGMVAEYGERVVGFMIYELHKDKIHVLDLAVAPEFRRQQVGHQMIAKLVGKLSSHRRTRITVDIHELHLAALLAFKSNGFLATHIIRDPRCDGTDDIAMAYDLAVVGAGGWPGECSGTGR